MIYKVTIFLLLAFSMTGFFYYIRKKDLVKTKMRQIMNRLEETSAERARETKRNILYQTEKLSFAEKILQKPRKRFLYSRLGYLTGITLEVWIIVKIIVAAMIYFIGYVILKNVVSAAMAAAVFWFLLDAMEMLMALKNYRSVDENLIQFINLLGNFSVTTGEITGILHKISKYMPEPLCSVFEECYIDAQTSGDTSVALYVMAEKVEHPKFKELIRNIEACINYTSNFKSAVDNSRKIIMDEQRAKRERKAIANGAVVNMVMICAMLVMALVIVEGLIERSIWGIFLYEGIGRASLTVIAITLLLFWHTLSQVDK